MSFQSKPELALALIDQAKADGVPFGIVVSDGDDLTFRDGLAERTLTYRVAVHGDFGVRLPDEIVKAAQPAKRNSGRPRKDPYPAHLAPIRRADAVLAG